MYDTFTHITCSSPNNPSSLVETISEVWIHRMLILRFVKKEEEKERKKKRRKRKTGKEKHKASHRYISLGHSPTSHAKGNPHNHLVPPVRSFNTPTASLNIKFLPPRQSRANTSLAKHTTALTSYLSGHSCSSSILRWLAVLIHHTAVPFEASPPVELAGAPCP